MKTTNLICNACRKTETLDGEASPYGSYVPGAAIFGWYRVQVATLRPMPSRPSLISSYPAGYPMPTSMPSMRGADLCPECGPKILANLEPHLIGDPVGFASTPGGFEGA